MLNQMPQTDEKVKLEGAIRNYLLSREDEQLRRKYEIGLFNNIGNARRVGLLVDGTLLRLVKDVEAFHSLRSAVLYWTPGQLLDWAMLNLKKPHIVSRLRYFEENKEMCEKFKTVPAPIFSDHVDQHMFGEPPSVEMVSVLVMLDY